MGLSGLKIYSKRKLTKPSATYQVSPVLLMISLGTATRLTAAIKNLQAVMSRARETGLRFNADKCEIRCTELPFFGHIISANGLRLDP